MIKNWSKFNESSETFTEEMAQEILYFFGEESKASKEIGDIFNRIYKTYNLNHITFYETSYEEMKEYTEYLFKRSTEDPELRQKLIELYNVIRKEMEVFPQVYEIEDMYLSVIEDLNFDFYLGINSIEKKVKIKLTKWAESKLSEFIEICKIVEGSLKRLESDKYKTTLDSCKFHTSYVEFEINLEA
jgi:hypothetical protein